MGGQFTSGQPFFVNGLARIIDAVELKGVLGNINTQHNTGHVDLPSKIMAAPSGFALKIHPVWCKYSNAPYDIVINQYYG